jgi:hypothetical protein
VARSFGSHVYRRDAPLHPPASRTTRRRGAALLAAILVASMSAALVPSTAEAFWGQPPAQSMTLKAPATSVAGQSVNVIATLESRRGQGAGRAVTLFLNGVALATRFTDSSGRAGFTIPGSALKVAGSYSLKAYAANRFGQGASASASLTVTTAAAAARPQTFVARRTSVSLSIPTGSPLGSDVTVTATIKDTSGRRLAGQRLAIWLEAAQLKTDVSNAAGQVAFLIPGRKLDQARAYAVEAVFSGSHGYLASSATSTLSVIMAAIEIRTVPPLPGVAFALGGFRAQTGPDGVAAMPVPVSGTYKLTADLNPSRADPTAARASFVRWADGVATPDRNIVVTGPATYEMGLRIADMARIRYVDSAGRTLDPALVQQARFAAADGTELSINSQNAAGEFWLTASTSTGTPGSGLIAAPVTYHAVSARVHGLEALDPGQQSWTPIHGGTWTVRLSVYDLTIRTLDAITGAGVSGQVRLVMPDGSSMAATAGAAGKVTFTGLPAGRYQVSLNSAGSAMTVSLPGPQDQTMRVVTAVDVVGLIGAWFGFAALMFFTVLGRGRLPLRLRRFWRAQPRGPLPPAYR